MADQTSVSAAELEQTLFVENTNLVIRGIVAIYDWHGKLPIQLKYSMPGSVLPLAMFLLRLMKGCIEVPFQMLVGS